MKKIALFSLLASLALVSCKDKCIHGDENVIMNPSRFYDPFDIVQSDLSLEHSLYIIPVNDTLQDEVQFYCESNLDPYIFTYIDPQTKTLHIESDPDHCLRTKKTVEIYVYVHKLAGITSNSSGHIYCDSLNNPTGSLDLRVISNGSIRMRALDIDILTADLAGSGSIDVEGDGRMGYYTNRGPSQLKASSMKMRGNCSATNTGAGTISLWCDGILTADPGPTGFVYYYGSPIEINAPIEGVIPGP